MPLEHLESLPGSVAYPRQCTQPLAEKWLQCCFSGAWRPPVTRDCVLPVIVISFCVRMCIHVRFVVGVIMSWVVTKIVKAGRQAFNMTA